MRWRKVPNTEGVYEASDTGSVRHRLKGKLLTPTVSRGKYLVVTLCFGHKQVTRNLHRIVAETFIPKRDASATVVTFRNGNPQDCRVQNLQWASRKEVSKTSVERSPRKVAKGSHVATAKLNERQVIEIKQGLSTGTLSVSELAQAYKVSPSTIRAIRAGRTWGHVVAGTRARRKPGRNTP